MPTPEGIVLRRIDANTLEAEMPRARDLNALFSALTSHGIVVKSMRNKTNRLEELFVRLVEQGRVAPARNGREQVA
jgi:ABC-2 type transport system ATP-binding protein